MSEQMIIDHCSPTLAGLKTGNLFPCNYESKEELWLKLRDFNDVFGEKGIRIVPLRMDDCRALIYLYRPQKLEKDMDNEKSIQILEKLGYRDLNPSKCIVELMRRFKEKAEFPHEIGLFLGYPPEDVLGFMEHRDEGCKCVGCWKVYYDEEYARKCFASYKKCTRIYKEQYRKGKSISQLTIAV